MKRRLLILVGILICAAGIYWILNDTGGQTTSISADQIAEEFKADETAATSKYGGEKLLVTGKVAEVSESGELIMLKTDEGIFISCAMTEKVTQAGQLQGSEVSIEGICSGLLMDIQFIQCRLQ